MNSSKCWLSTANTKNKTKRTAGTARFLLPLHGRNVKSGQKEPRTGVGYSPIQHTAQMAIKLLFKMKNVARHILHIEYITEFSVAKTLSTPFMFMLNDPRLI